MARETELRGRVERLLRGECRPDDFARLFLWLRERSYGLESIRELGNFIAHSDERYQGLVTEDAKDFFRILRLQPPPNTPFDLSDLPPDFCLAVKGNFRRLESADIKRATGLKRNVAERVLNNALAKFPENQQGRRSLQQQLTQEEIAVIRYILGTFVSRPAFTDDTLFRDFLLVLEKNKLIEASERRALACAKPALALFTIAHLHHVDLLLDDGWSAQLLGSYSDGCLGVTVVAPALRPASGGGSVLIAGSMFATGMKPEDWCSSELLAFPDTGGLWHCAIEVTAEPKLVIL